MFNNRRSYQSKGNDFKQWLGLDNKFGHLHEVRIIPNTSPKVLAVKIGVPQGQGDQITYQEFDLVVKQADAFSLFEDLKDVINNNDHKATVRFSCFNIRAGAYIANQGEKKGQAIPYLKGTLSHLHNLKIDGDVVYGWGKEENQEGQESAQTAEPSTETAGVKNKRESKSKPKAATA